MNDSAGPGGAREALERLARWMAVREGFQPLGNLFPTGRLPAALGMFDACLARWEGQDLRVHALLADEGGGEFLARHRAESLRRELSSLEPAVRGRLRAAAWLVVADEARAAAVGLPFLDFTDAHFLSKTVVGRGLVVGRPARAEFRGSVPTRPDTGTLASALADPSADPGPEETARILAEQEGRAARRSAEERSSAHLLRPGPAPATWVLMGLNTGCYAVQWMLAGQLERQGVRPDVAASTVLLRLGANEPGLTLGSGQVWRLLACSLLHAGWWHLGMNMYALFLVGAVVERLVGPWRMLGLYLFSALVAGTASVLAASPGSYSVGASGAIMGLIGVLMAPRFRRDPRMPEVLAERLFQWLSRPVALIFALGLALRLFDAPLLLDNAAHLGGLLAGFGLGYLWPSFLVRPTRRRA